MHLSQSLGSIIISGVYFDVIMSIIDTKLVIKDPKIQNWTRLDKRNNRNLKLEFKAYSSFLLINTPQIPSILLHNLQSRVPKPDPKHIHPFALILHMFAVKNQR